MSAPRLFLFLCLVYQGLTAQVSFDTIPAHLQFIPRNKQSLGLLRIAGSTGDPAIRQIRLTVKRSADDTLINSSAAVLSSGRFSETLLLPSSLHQYTLYVQACDSAENCQLAAEVRDIVVGDLFIVSGQSNAVAPPDPGYLAPALDSLYELPFNRVIGGDFGYSLQNNIGIEDDSRFKRPSTVHLNTADRGYLGVWPLKLQHDLSLSTGVPICFVHAGQGGSTISKHLSSHTPSDPQALKYSGDSARLYDRMFAKVNRNGLCIAVKAIFWYQGESDAGLPASEAIQYEARFLQLKNSWYADFPALEKIFVLQMNAGCGGNFGSYIRDLQRNSGRTDKKILLMSTMGCRLGDRSQDGCHYTTKGYLGIADNLYKPVLKAMYGFSFNDDDILPPNILRAYYSRSGQICLEFDKAVLVQDELIYPGASRPVRLKEHFFRQDNVPIKLEQISYESNKVFLDLSSENDPIDAITYLPDNISNVSTVYNGPWILNAANENIGALTFFKVPVENLGLGGSFSIYPNPSEGKVKVMINDKAAGRLSLFNLQGVLISRQEIQNHTSGFWLDVSERGVYIVEIELAGKTERKKLVVF